MNPEHAEDGELRGLGMAALHEHEVSVSDAETESALDAVRARLAGGEQAGASPVFAARSARSERPSWALLAAAAAVVALIAGGLVVAFGGSADDTIVPATDGPRPEITTAPTTPDTTVEPDDSTVTETTPDSTEAPTPFVRQTIAVDASNPPPLIEPRAFATVPRLQDPSGNAVSVAIGPTGIAFIEPGAESIVLVGPDGSVERLPIEEQISDIVLGPGSVVYGFGDPTFDEENQVAPRGFRFPAIAIAGERAGETVAFGELDVNGYLEIPPFFFGNGPDGIIDRGRQVGETLIEHVDETGAPFEPVREFPIPAFADVDGDGFRDVGDGLIEVIGSEPSWQLDIRRDAAHAGTYVGPSPPAPTTGGRVVYFERIGADLTPGEDFGPNGMPVVAVLNPDGSGTWVRLPEEWDVVASDVWGTVLMRQTDADLEFALLDDSLPPTPTELAPTSVPTPTAPDVPPQESLSIPRNCVSDAGCTQLANTEDGRIVAYDPTDETLRVYDSTGGEVQVEIPIDADVTPLDLAWFVDVGPDDVAYLAASTAASVDSQVDLIAIPLVGDKAGQVVMVWTGLDGSGDSTLVPRRAGLTFVPCCGMLVPRPAPEAPIYRWIDRNGAAIESTAPSFDLTLGDAGSSLTRIDGEATFTRFTLPTVFQNPRDFPTTIATDDGGALALDFVMPNGPTVIVDFNTDWPEFGIDNSDVYFLDETPPFGSILLEPAGTVVVGEDDRFVRRTLDEIGTPGWPGTAIADFETATMSAPGLNEYIDENSPSWAADPTAFAYQLVPWIGPNETVTVEYDEPTITITTSGFLDDSVAASRRVITTVRGDDGLLRFVTGTYGQQCQPGRGHQDFSNELCI